MQYTLSTDFFLCESHEINEYKYIRFVNPIKLLKRQTGPVCLAQ